jgi:MoxR-like ATPase
LNELVASLRTNLARVIKGKPGEIDALITALLANGNVLLTDVPGVGKTTLAKSIAASIAGTFRRIQFTPDLLPADVLGGSIYNPREGTFAFRKGPVFANVLLADEINRASPRTQSALLEAMAEGQVSIEGETYALPRPFWVVATQNPVEYHGTYPLPEAQLDRFAIQLALGYPPEEEELLVLSSQDKGHPLDGIGPVTTTDAIVLQQKAVREIHVDEDVGRYIVAILRGTREDKRLQLGVSPRGGIALYRMAQARAFLDARKSVLPDDVKAVAVGVLAHRILLETKAKYSGVTKETVIKDVLARTKVPV